MESVGVAGHKEMMIIGALVTQQREVLKAALELPGYGRRGVDNRSGRWNNSFDEGSYQRIVRTAQHKSIGAFVEHRRKYLMQKILGDRIIDEARFDELYQTDAGVFEHGDAVAKPIYEVGVALAGESAAGGQNAYHARLRSRRSGFNGGFHADDGYRRPVVP